MYGTQFGGCARTYVQYAFCLFLPNHVAVGEKEKLRGEGQKGLVQQADQRSPEI